MTIINESGLYAAILRSRRPEAVQFHRWITADLLPNLRKNGFYGAPALTAANLIRLEDALARHTKRLIVATNQAERDQLYASINAMNARLGRETAAITEFGHAEPDHRTELAQFWTSIHACLTSAPMGLNWSIE